VGEDPTEIILVDDKLFVTVGKHNFPGPKALRQVRRRRERAIFKGTITHQERIVRTIQHGRGEVKE
jgi:hypothetical protein